MNWEHHLVDLLTASVLRPFALAATAWLLLRVFGIRHPASRHAAWTAVLATTLLLPPLTLIAPKMTLRVLPSKTFTASTIPSTGAAINLPVTESFSSIEAAPEPANAQTPHFHWPNLPNSQTLVVWLYLAGLLAMLAWRFIAWNVLRQIMSGSKRIHRFVHQSNDVLTPVTCGVRQPSIILPMDWRAWPQETRRAALAHEYAHICRHDMLTLALTRFATCIYWFHPLSWWLARQISDLAELSCDAAVLEKSGNATAYTRILLTFAEKVTEAQRRIALPRMAFATSSGMSRRIDRIFELSGGNLRKLSRPKLLLSLAGLPLTCLIAAVGFGSPTTPSHFELPKPAEPNLFAQSTPASETTARQSIIAPAPIIPTSTPPQHLEALTSFSPVGSENIHDVLVVHGTLPKLFAQSMPASAQRRTPQPVPSVRLEFDAASVKPIKGYSGGGGRSGPLAGPPLDFQPGRVVASLPFGTTALRLIMEAYHLTAQQVSGAPDWLESDRFEIEAKAPDAGAGKDQLRQMLQALLADRFKLVISRNTRTIPVYALVPARSGHKLHEIKEGEVLPDTLKELAARGLMPPMRTGVPFAGLMRGHESMDEFAAKLSDNPNFSDRPVLNKTGLKGVYLTFLLWHEGDLATAMEEQFGLKVESQKDSVEVVSIDHIEKPDPN